MYKLLKNRVALLSVLLFFAAPYRSNAQTIGDASIFYRFYNDDSVRVTITFFSKTNSFSAAPLIVTPEKSTPFTVNLTKTSGSFNGSVVIQYSYYATIGLKNFTDCNFTFSWKANNRQINGKGLYLEATLNNCLFRANKSGRTPEPEMVIGSPCINSCNSISVASNTDWIGLNDSVSYSFVNARLDRDTIYAYPSGYDSSKPMSLATSSTCSGFNLNTQTGMITFMPAKSEWTVVAIKATHWTKDKNGIFQKVGTVMHDEELYMSTCGGNKPPVISGINGGTGTHLDLCYGDTVCFTINAYDEDSMYGEVVDMFDKWNGIPGSTFETTREKNYLKGQFCLDTRYNTTGRLSPHFFTVMATDINSGYLRTQKTFSIKVHGVPLVNAGRDTTICLSGNKLMLKGSLYSLADGSYSTNGTWTTADPNTKGLFNSTTPYFDPSVSGIGNFKLVYSYNNQSQGCYISDTVLIKVLPVAKVNGGNYAAQCAGSMQLKLTGSRKDGIWGANAAGLVTKDSFEVYYFSPSKAGPGKHKLWYTAILKDSCAETDTVIINVLPYSNVKGGTYNAQCVETTDLILGGSHKNGTWNTSSPLLITKDISGIYHFSPNKAGIGLHKLWYSAPFHKDSCPQTDTIFIQVDSNCVWPGDANRDKTADYLDILDIALGYSSTGSPRLNASTNWIPQLSKDWSNSLSSGINYKHLDTNGD
ncbi:MAG: hypothetical protein ACXWD4_12675, partial [Bacteroidia bacterium]